MHYDLEKPNGKHLECLYNYQREWAKSLYTL